MTDLTRGLIILVSFVVVCACTWGVLAALALWVIQ